MSMNLSLEGVDEVLNALGALNARVLEARERGLVEGGEVIRAEIEENLNNKMVNARTGVLKGAMQLSSIQSNHKGTCIYIGDIGKKTYKGRYRRATASGRESGRTGHASYAYFVEFGTETAAPHPYMRTAYRVKKEAATRKMLDAIKEGVTNA